MALCVAISGEWSYAAINPDPGTQRGRGQEMVYKTGVAHIDTCISNVLSMARKKRTVIDKGHHQSLPAINLLQIPYQNDLPPQVPQ
jgi:hypothetical protein